MELIKRSTDYAIRALVHLACSDRDVESVTSIAEARAIPLLFLQKIMQKLTKAGLVRAQVGAAGGVSLAADPRSVTLKQVMDISQGAMTVSRCLMGTKKCARQELCPLTSGWGEVQHKIDGFLNSITLADLAAKARDAGHTK